jgi:transposase
LAGYNAYAYIGLDIERKSIEANKTFQRAKDKKMDTGQVFEHIKKQGLFVLVSSQRITSSNVLPLYYTRQQIEQVFDIGKNYADMLPLRVQTEETFRGHLLLTFIATVIIKTLQEKLKNTPINPLSLFQILRNQKCKVYGDKVITAEACKRANDCYKLFGIKCPVSIAFS